MECEGGGLCSPDSWVVKAVEEVFGGLGSLKEPLLTGGGLDSNLLSPRAAANWDGSTDLESAVFLGASVGFTFVTEGDPVGLTCGSVTAAVDTAIDSADFASSGFSVGEPGVDSEVLVGGGFMTTSPAVALCSTRPGGFWSVSFCSFGGCGWGVQPFLAASISRSAC